MNGGQRPACDFHAPKELGERRRWRRGWLRPHCHARPPARAPSRGHWNAAARPSACVAPSAIPATCVDSPAAKEDRCFGNARRAAASPRPPLARAPSRVAARKHTPLPVSRAVQHPSHLLWIACQRCPAPRLTTPTRSRVRRETMAAAAQLVNPNADVVKKGAAAMMNINAARGLQVPSSPRTHP